MTPDIMFKDEHEFENEVRRIARLLWPEAAFGGQAMESGKERDGVFITGGAIYLLECTVSRSKDKAAQDGRKLADLAKQMLVRHPMKAVKGFFVTLHEPTAEQRTVIQQYGPTVVATSFSQFKSMLIDANQYLLDRSKYHFGSMRESRSHLFSLKLDFAGDLDNKQLSKELKEQFQGHENPLTPQHRVQVNKSHSEWVIRDGLTSYVIRAGSLSLNVYDGSDFQYVKQNLISNSGHKWSVSQIVSDLLSGKSFLLLGDYGAGKSTTMREIFLDLTKKYRANRSSKFPIMLNLRDHHGQTNPSEALIRHANNIGYKSPDDLVRAWLAGEAILMLDGFDEIAIVGWSGQAKKLKDIRYRSMQLLREFIRNIPPEASVVISGRTYFFDNDQELERALGIDSRFIQINLSDFNDEQVREYLEKKGWREAIPSWLPTRPLLLGYLAAKGVLDQVVTDEKGLTPAVGWDMLLARVCDREAEIEAGIDGETVRLLVERLATKTRRSSDGVGLLQPDDIMQAFQQVCGYSPDDHGLVLLQRLPGLGPNQQEDGSRSFVDRDFVEAARAGDIVRYIQTPFSFEIENPADWQLTLEPLGRELAAYLCRKKGFSSSKISISAQHSGKKGDSNALTADIIEILKEMECGFTGPFLEIKNIVIADTSIGDSKLDFSQVMYQGCLFRRLEIASDADPATLPRFSESYFAVIEGRLSEKDLPPNVFQNGCVFDSFDDNYATNDAILSTPLPVGVRVLLTVLNKLYLQAGSGRKESAFFRGLDHRARPLVPQVLQLLRRENLVIRLTTGEETVWLPVRSEGVRVRRIVSAPTASKDHLVEQAATVV